MQEGVKSIQSAGKAAQVICGGGRHDRVSGSGINRQYGNHLSAGVFAGFSQGTAAGEDFQGAAHKDEDRKNIGKPAQADQVSSRQHESSAAPEFAASSSFGQPPRMRAITAASCFFSTPATILD